MILEQYKPSDRDTWHWRQAILADVDDIVRMAVQHFQLEIDSYLTPTPDIYARNLALAIIKQNFNNLEEQIIVARHNDTNQLVAYAWIVRGVYVTYAPEEIADARVVHIDLSLSIRKRMTICAQVLQQWELWAMICGIPVISSSSIRTDQSGFLHLHKLAGYDVRGSAAYKRITHG